MLRCAIVEDSPRELEHLKECLARYSAERDIPLETTAFGDAASFLEHYRADYDIVFMDIELPGINGIGITYDDQDTLFSLVYKRERDSEDSVANDWSIGARLSFRTLGDINVGDTKFDGLDQQ